MPHVKNHQGDTELLGVIKSDPHLVPDALPEHIAVLNREGIIVSVNAAWREFGRQNQGPTDGALGRSYLETCDLACDLNEEGAAQAARGLRAVLAGTQPLFEMEYPCHSPDRKHWFHMLAAPMMVNGQVAGAVVSHFDITSRVQLEINLTESEQYYRSVADHACDWEWWVDPKGRFLYVSPSSEEVTGYKAEEFLADPGLLDRILHPEDKARYSGSMVEIIQETPEHRDAFRIIRADGRTIWIGHVCRPVYDVNGAWLGRRAGNQDITIHKQHEEELRRSQLIIDSTPNIISVVDRNYVYLMANQAHLRFFSITKENIIGKTVLEVVGPDLFHNVLKELLDKCLTGETFISETWFDIPGTDRKCLYISHFPYRMPNGEITGVVVSARDITGRKQAEEALALSERRLRAAQKLGRMGDIEHDLTTGEGYWSDELFRLMDYPPDSFRPTLGDAIRRVHPEDRDPLVETIQEAILSGGEAALVFRVVRTDGSITHLSGQIKINKDDQGRSMSFHGVVVDVTQLKEAEAKLREMATTDDLTGIHNRRNFLELTDREVARSQRHSRPLSLLMMDIDHFKNVNDTYGHDVGDLVLKAVVRRTRSTLRDTDHLGRFGGEEFVALLPETGLEAAVATAERILKVVSATPMETPDHSFTVTISIGVAELQDHLPDTSALLKAADQAMYEAKNNGRNQVRTFSVKNSP